MDALQKLRLLGPATCYEPAEETDAPQPPPRRARDLDLEGAVYNAVLPGGKRIPLLKTLLTSACERNCIYCPFRDGRDFRRTTFTPDELAGAFIQLHRQGVVEGIFLSSGVAGGGANTQERILATAEILRQRYEFRGYLHLKVMPDAERDQVLAAMRLANRVSVNLEAPNAERLAALAPRKNFASELLQRLQWIEEIRRSEPGPWPSSTTQFVVGAVDESDSELLTTTDYLYHNVGLKRAYFSSFSPVIDTPLEGHPPSPAQREHRLYQSSFLLRDYGFSVEELPFDAEGNLPQDRDPKLAWAERHLSHAPIEVNSADRAALLRVPGIGPTSADRILRARRQGALRDLADLRKLGIAPRRAIPFILLAGRRPPRQLALW